MLTKLFSREYSVQYTEISIRSLLSESKRHLPSLVFSQTYLPEDKNASCYANLEEWQKFLGNLSKKYQNKQNLNKFFKQFHFYGKKYFETSKKIVSKNLQRSTNQNLASYYKVYQKSLIEYSTYVWMGYLLSLGYHSEKAKKLLEDKRVTDEKVASALFCPSQLSGILSMQKELSLLKAKTKHLQDKQIKLILKKYIWMPCLDIHNNPWTNKDVGIFFAHIKSPVKQISFAKATKLAGLNKKEIELFRLVRELVYIKDMRDEYRRKGVYSILPLFEIIAKNLGVTREELAYFTSKEIIDALNRSVKLKKSIALSRQKGFLIYANKNKIEVTSDVLEIRKFVKKNVETNKATTNEIKGTIASKGQGKGKVKIVFGIKDLNKVKRGDVMVAITTHPDFVPAMHRAVAIVTDEGGLTSHAAIVSREMGVPCIVGTKTATKILKDGDLVMVDANNGTVKVIKN
jgi:phosphoenolpyruvate synthase/pyruvate phosphate dikinase